MTEFKVWVDQDLCTGDGLCVDHCPEVFVLLEDGISYVHSNGWVGNEPGGDGSVVAVPFVHEHAVIDAIDVEPTVGREWKAAMVAPEQHADEQRTSHRARTPCTLRARATWRLV